MRALLLPIRAALLAVVAACSVKPVTFTPGDDTPRDASVVFDVPVIVDEPRFTITVEVVGSGAGVVTSTPGGLQCPGTCTLSVLGDTTVTLTVEAATGSTFLGWGDACAGTGTCSFTVTADRHVTVGLSADLELIVTRAGNGNGGVTSSPPGIACAPDCAEVYPAGQTVTLAAQPLADSTFLGWSGDCAGTTCEVTVDRARLVTASFALQSRELRVTRRGPGDGTVTSDPIGISCGTDCAEAYDAHTKVTLSTDPAADSLFVGWTGGGCGAGPTCVVTLDEAADVTATFGLRPFTLSVTKDGSGTGLVTSSPAGISCGTACAKDYTAHTGVTLAAQPSPGSAFIRWTGACVGGGACAITMDGARSVTATFSTGGPMVTIDQEGSVGGRLKRFDPITQAVVDVGPLGLPYAFGDCAWHAGNAALYVTDGRPETAANALYRVDLATGAATLVGVHGIADMFGLAYHPPSNQLFGIGQSGGLVNLYRLDTATGAATLIGPTGITSPAFVDGLAWDSKRNVMVALTAGSSSALFTINLATGAATQIVATTGFNDLGMAYEPISDRFLALDFNGVFVQFDPANGFARTNLGTVPIRTTCLAFTP